MRRYLHRGLALAVMLLVMTGALSSPARADVDIELVAESVADAGFYRDSRAQYFKSDTALDALRDSQGRKVPVYVVVLPKSENPDAVLTQLMQRSGQRGTYAVLAGDRIRVRSNVYTPAQVARVHRRAVAANPGRPDKAVLTLVRLMPTANAKPPQDPGVVDRPLADSGVANDQKVARKEAAQRAQKAAEKDDGGGRLLPVLAGVVVVLLLGVGGFLLLRRRGKGKGGQAPAGAPAGPGEPTPQPGTAPAPAGAGQPGAAPAPAGPGEPGPQAGAVPPAAPGAAEPPKDGPKPDPQQGPQA